MKNMLLLLVMTVILFIGFTQFNKKSPTEKRQSPIVQEIVTKEPIVKTLAKPKKVLQANIATQSPIFSQKDPQNKTPITKKETLSQIDKKSQKELKRDILLNMKIQMTKTMQEMPDCYQKAQTKKEAVACNKTMHQINKEFVLMLGQKPDENYEKNLNNFTWDEETKITFIQGIDESIVPMQELFDCFLEAESQSDKMHCLSMDEEEEQADTLEVNK